MNKENENGSGYRDDTANIAISRADYDRKKVNDLVRCIKLLCKIAGFHLEGSIILVNNHSKKEYIRR